MKNLLKLHEAIVVVLLSMPKNTASFEEIAKEIERRGLFPERKGGVTLTEQIRLRTTISSSKYKHLLNVTKPDRLVLI